MAIVSPSVFDGKAAQVDLVRRAEVHLSPEKYGLRRIGVRSLSWAVPPMSWQPLFGMVEESDGKNIVELIGQMVE